ncbi:type II toxin-antitoxin system YafO family toxin, partial [Streptococcus danieliae]|nr:type II toxin-antitoxin system YafO family toxin [Streptococcus danieliae]
EMFADFKAGPPLGSKYFGKDVGYEAPLVAGKSFVLKHVHMIPRTDPVALERWNEAYKSRSQKTSDRALVYVTNAVGDHLLLWMLEEPLAHKIAKMRDPADVQLMQAFALIAADFLRDGSIIS